MLGTARLGTAKLIVVLIDGVSADYFAGDRERLPHPEALARGGILVDRMRPEVCGTSLPGRGSPPDPPCAPPPKPLLPLMRRF